MQASFLTRSTVLALLLAGVACAGNNSSDTEIGAARDTSAERISDSTNANQTEPVTSEGDTVNSGIDSSTTAR